MTLCDVLLCTEEGIERHLILTIIEHFDNIRMLYKAFESKRPIVLYDVEAGELQPLPYNAFKSILISEDSQILLEEEYQYAQRNNKILVVVSDSKYQTIKTCSIDKKPQKKVSMPKLKTIFE